MNMGSGIARLSFVVAAALGALSVAWADDPLLAGFQNPPDSAKPQTWWHWINGNISKEGITADLEAMKKIGLGGAEIFNVEVGVPAGDTPFMSPQWQVAIAHAFREAKRLGLQICVHNCAGWSSSGGPWIKPEYAMQFLTWTETPVTGPSHFDGELPQPKATADYYGDIAVYAVKNPGNAEFRIPNIRPKAAFERGDRILPETDKAPYNASIASKDVVMLKADASGHIVWDVPAGSWTLIRMGHTPTGAQNEPSPASGLGLEVDKLSRQALDTHWAGMMSSVLMDNGTVEKYGLNNALIDSYEVGSQNWSPEFRQDFIDRRGYDPMPYLPVVTGRVIGSDETSERFLWDLRRTISDLFRDNYFNYFGQLCHTKGLMFSTEGYGNGSFDNLDAGGTADIPMGEFWVGGGAIETTKLAASSGHIYGRTVIGAESFTAGVSEGRFRNDPYSIKALGDKVFTLGINRYIFHRYAHQPWMDVRPGMTMGPWGIQLDRTETWWDQGAAWMKYIARCQDLLQSGRFIADVLAYEGEEGPNDMPLLYGNTVPPGYDYDGCSAAVLMKATVEKGEIVLPSGMRYRVLMLPQSQWMTPHIANKIADLVRAGAIVLGPQPVKSPSLGDEGAGDAEVARIGKAVWGRVDGTKATHGGYGKGHIFNGVPLSSVLQSIRRSPDVLQDGKPWNLNWLHRQVGDADVYFVANPRYTPATFTVSFRVAEKQPELWNPMTGNSTSAPVWRQKDGRTSVQLNLDSAGSMFVVFRGKPATEHWTAVTVTSTDEQARHVPVVEIEAARYEAVDGTGMTDVTDKVRQMVKNGDTEIGATNSNFGDPAYNHVKRLVVNYFVDGKRQQKTVNENEMLSLIGAGPDNAPPDYQFTDGKLFAWASGNYSLADSKGKAYKVHSDGAKRIDVAGPWTLTFPEGLGAPESASMDTLKPWNESSDPGIKYFSGSATYSTTFDVSPEALNGGRAYLDLGRVKNFAEVWINGHLQPTLWKSPFRLAATGLHAGKNELKVRVTNLWPNRLIGDEQLPAEDTYNGGITKLPQWAIDLKPRPKSERVTWTTWHFYDKDSPLMESGMMGPVQVVIVPEVVIKK